MTRKLRHDAADLTHRIDTIGAEAAFQALLEVCQDKKAAAPARATAGTSLLRAAGRFDKDRYRASDKPPEDMSAAELAAAIARLKAEREGLLADLSSDPDDDDDLRDEDDSSADKPDLFG
ncbi:hypothetical protein [Paracoccus liaowanqingii]|uniref:hypothetical protein n=1 Tax=Paracoccus liaowanqingii TaxID=2560053 RepID=UPI00143CCCF2|nr:hypothetical protein [Paracoccus liaowanqingii]